MHREADDLTRRGLSDCGHAFDPFPAEEGVSTAHALPRITGGVIAAGFFQGLRPEAVMGLPATARGERGEAVAHFEDALGLDLGESIPVVPSG